MYIRAERKATGRRPEVGNGEQRPRCDGVPSGMEHKRNGTEGVCLIQNCEYPVGTRRAVSAVRAQAIYLKLRLSEHILISMK